MRLQVTAVRDRAHRAALIVTLKLDKIDEE